MKKELLTGALVAGAALTGAARPHWGHGGHHFWPGFAGGAVGAFTAHAISDAMWASRGYLPVYRGYYGYGVVTPTVVTAPVVSSPVIYQQPQVVYQQPVVQQPVYQQPVVQQARPVQQPAPQPQEVRIVVDHQYPAQAVQQATQNNQQQQRQ